MVLYPGELWRPVDWLGTSVCHKDEEPGWEMG